VNAKDWLELPGGDSEQPISKHEPEQITGWLVAQFK
jgi:acyl-homoserine lactone acylase PvdQ